MRNRSELVWILGCFCFGFSFGQAATAEETRKEGPPLSAPPGQALRRPPMGLDFLEAGQRVKVEGKRFRDGKLIAETIEVVDPDDEFEIEGVVSHLDVVSLQFRIGTLQIQMGGSTSFENAERNERHAGDLRDGMRVKVKAKERIAGVIRAKTVRIYEESSDRDVELEGQIDSIDPQGLELSMLSATVAVTHKTRYPNIRFVGPQPGDPSAGPGIRREEDEPDFAAFRIGPVYLGGRAGMAFEQMRNLDLSDSREDASDWLIPSGRVQASLPLGEHSELYAKLDMARGWDLGDAPLDNSRGMIELSEAFIYLGNFFHPTLGLQIGRQRFRDKREWIYDDQLDAVRLHFKKSRFKLEAAVAQSIFSSSGSRSDQLYLICRGEQRLPGRRSLAGYLIKRNDTTGRDEDPIWIGVQSQGRITRDLDYWVELSQMMGRRGRRSLRGYGYDIGASYRVRVPWEPTATFGYAFGSGDSNPNDDVDNTFRQTRLNDNNARINGLKRYKYYGVLTDPELHNLKIQTLDFGLRPSKTLSVNFIYHSYRQSVPDRDLGDILINARPNGRDPRLGEEFDVVFAIRIKEKLDIGLLTGIFRPGPAFTGARPSAFLFRPAFLFYF